MSAAMIAELERLLPQAKRANTRVLLETELKRQRDTLDKIPAPHATPAAPNPPKPLKTQLQPTPNSTIVFGTISKYAWDQSKKFVKVYLTLPGIEKVSDDSIHLDVQTTSLKFEVYGLSELPANRRLAVATLHSAVDAWQSSWTRKADSMILIKLKKASECEPEWGSLDDSAIQKARRKAEEVEQNKGKSTSELLSKMYADADEEGKKSLEEAWEAGRSKREGRN